MTLTTRVQIKGGRSIFKPWRGEGFIYLRKKNQIGMKQYKLQTNKKKIKEMYCIIIYIWISLFISSNGGRRGRDRMAVGFNSILQSLLTKII